MRVLFVNTQSANCGVHQYGENVRSILGRDPTIKTWGGIYDSEEALRKSYDAISPDFVIYNWQQIIGGWMGGAPFDGMGKQVLLYHDLEARFDDFDAILFSDPTMKQHGKWHPIPRPLNLPYGIQLSKPDESVLTLGVNGLVGAWATLAVGKMLNDFKDFHIRMHLPSSTFCDPDGSRARATADSCRAMLRPGVTMDVNHNYLPWDHLLVWLSCNHMNVYVRSVEPWRGVSSITDAALCVGRPIAVNRCEGFRHLFDCEPTIVADYRSLPDILASGIGPLFGKYKDWSQDSFRNSVKNILCSL